MIPVTYSIYQGIRFILSLFESDIYIHKDLILMKYPSQITNNPVKYIKHLLGSSFEQQNIPDIQPYRDENGSKSFSPKPHNIIDYRGRRQESE